MCWKIWEGARPAEGKDSRPPHQGSVGLGDCLNLPGDSYVVVFRL